MYVKDIRTLHCFMMGADIYLPPNDILAIMHALEEYNIILAKEKQFKAIFATNTSPVTQVGIKTYLSEMCQFRIRYIHHFLNNNVLEPRSTA